MSTLPETLLNEGTTISLGLENVNTRGQESSRPESTNFAYSYVAEVRYSQVVLIEIVGRLFNSSEG